MWWRPKTLERENHLLKRKGGPARETAGVMEGWIVQRKIAGVVWYVPSGLGKRPHSLCRRRIVYT